MVVMEYKWLSVGCYGAEYKYLSVRSCGADRTQVAH